MESLYLIVSLLLGAAVGSGVTFALARTRFHGCDETRAELDQAREALRQEELQMAALNERVKRIDELEEAVQVRELRLEDLQTELGEYRRKEAVLEAQLAERERGFAEQLSTIEKAREELSKAFSEISQGALEKNNKLFLDLAEQNLRKLQESAKGELEKKQVAIDEMVKPIRESLEKVDQHVAEMEKQRAAAYAGLSEQVKGLMETQTRLQNETANLVRALRNPNQRGRWGEIQLRRVVEMAGMLEYCDFRSQETHEGAEGRLRPDLVVQLPNNKTIVVDAKTPLDAYLSALECADDTQRAEHLRNHARQVRTHITQLSGKRYWEQFASSPEVVVLFIPGEPMYNAALEQDPSLIEFGVDNKVLVATPVTLIGLLRSIAYGWRQERLQENAEDICRAGRDLYARVGTLADHFKKLGRNLDSAVSAYNETVGSLEYRVLPQARKFKELQAATKEDIPALEPIDRTTRRTDSPELQPLPKPKDATLFN